MKLLDILRKLGLIRENGIFYIGGSDVLPPPLKVMLSLKSPFMP